MPWHRMRQKAADRHHKLHYFLSLKLFSMLFISSMNTLSTLRRFSMAEQL